MGDPIEWYKCPTCEVLTNDPCKYVAHLDKHAEPKIADQRHHRFHTSAGPFTLDDAEIGMELFLPKIRLTPLEASCESAISEFLPSLLVLRPIDHQPEFKNAGTINLFRQRLRTRSICDKPQTRARPLSARLPKPLKLEPLVAPEVYTDLAEPLPDVSVKSETVDTKPEVFVDFAEILPDTTTTLPVQQTVDKICREENLSADHTPMPKLVFKASGSRLDAYRQLVENIRSQIPQSNFCRHCKKPMNQNSLKRHEEFCLKINSRAQSITDNSEQADNNAAQMLHIWPNAVIPFADVIVPAESAPKTYPKIYVKPKTIRRKAKVDTPVLSGNCAYCNKAIPKRRKVCRPKCLNGGPINGDKKMRPVSCRICQKMFFNPRNHALHFRNVCSKKPLPGCKCGLTFSTKENLRRHKESGCHTQNTEFNDSELDEIDDSDSDDEIDDSDSNDGIDDSESDDEIDHSDCNDEIDGTHGIDVKYDASCIQEVDVNNCIKFEVDETSVPPKTPDAKTCRKCGKVYSNLKSLRRHLREVCLRKAQEELKCVCGATFFYQANLVRHKAIACRLRNRAAELAEKLEPCRNCGKLVSAAYLLRHMRENCSISTEERQEIARQKTLLNGRSVCECGSSFVTASNLTLHQNNNCHLRRSLATNIDAKCESDIVVGQIDAKDLDSTPITQEQLTEHGQVVIKLE